MVYDLFKRRDRVKTALFKKGGPDYDIYVFTKLTITLQLAIDFILFYVRFPGLFSQCGSRAAGEQRASQVNWRGLTETVSRAVRWRELITLS